MLKYFKPPKFCLSGHDDEEDDTDDDDTIGEPSTLALYDMSVQEAYKSPKCKEPWNRHGKRLESLIRDRGPECKREIHFEYLATQSKMNYTTDPDFQKDEWWFSDGKFRRTSRRSEIMDSMYDSDSNTLERQCLTLLYKTFPWCIMKFTQGYDMGELHTAIDVYMGKMAPYDVTRLHVKNTWQPRGKYLWPITPPHPPLTCWAVNPRSIIDFGPFSLTLAKRWFKAHRKRNKDLARIAQRREEDRKRNLEKLTKNVSKKKCATQ